MTTPKALSLANHEIVTLAVYLLGGEAQRVDTEDIVSLFSPAHRNTPAQEQN